MLQPLSISGAIEVLQRALVPSDTAHIALPIRVYPLASVPEPQLRVIGRGTCGTIYTSASPSTVAYKVGSDGQALWNDIQLTTRAHRAVEGVRSTSKQNTVLNGTEISIPRIPAVQGWSQVEGRQTFWEEHAGSFTEFQRHFQAGSRIPYLFSTSLIPPIPFDARHALLSLFRFPTSKASVFADGENDFCLIRPYLGLATRKDQPLCRADNLWNFPLTLKDFTTLKLGSSGIDHLAREMAAGLAIIHWAAGIDGMDIEFVLGGTEGWNNQEDNANEFEVAENDEPFKLASNFTLDPRIRPAVQFQHTGLSGRGTHMYILDFDKASLLSFGRPDTAIQQLVTAVTCNDPYFPDPAAQERELWESFKEAYKQTAYTVIGELVQRFGNKARSWPTVFLQQWERKAEELADGKEGSFVAFGY